MIDEAYSLALLPASLRLMGIEGANAIEANLQYLILQLFPYFNGAVKTEAVGSYGFLELTETGTAGDAFLAIQALRIDRIKVMVDGADLSALTWQGAGWVAESSTETALLLTYTSSELLTAEQIQAALDDLRFTASADTDAELTLQVSNTVAGDYMPLGPVSMFFRDGTTWLLVEGKALTWNDVENAGMTWSDFENLKKMFGGIDHEQMDH